MTGYVEENTAIRTLFNAGWGSTTPIVYENEKYVPQANTPFVNVNIRPDNASQIELGGLPGSHHRHPGLIFVTVYGPPDRGTREALELADQAADIFRKQRSTYTNGRILYRTPTITPLGLTEEQYFQVNVVIPYVRDSYHT